MDAFLDLIASCDVIEPLTLAAYQAASGGGWVRIEFLRNDSWTGAEVERELKRFSIPVHGRGFTPKTKEHPQGTLFCYVKREQAAWAEYILQRAGVPLVSVIDARNEAWAAGKGPVPQWNGKPPVMPAATRVGNTPTSPSTKGERRGALAVGSGGKLDRFLSWLEGREVK